MNLPVISRRGAALGALGAFGSIAVLRSPARAATRTMKFGHNLPVDNPLHVRTTQMWAAVRRETGGRIDVKVYPSSQLGGDIAMLSQLRLGALEFMTLAGSILSSLVPVAGIESIPFAFKTAQDAYAAADGALGAHVRAEIEATGVHPFPKPFEIGFYQITNSVHPIRTVDDFAGIKMRTSNSKLAVDTFKSLGAAATPMNLSEVYTALQTHIVDGQYNPYSTIESVKFYEVQKYVSELNLAWGNFWLLSNKDVWASFSPADQAIVSRNASKYVDLQRRDTEQLSAASAGKLVRQGMIRNVAEPASFRAKLQESFYRRWRDEYGLKAWALLEQYAGKLA